MRYARTEILIIVAWVILMLACLVIGADAQEIYYYQPPPVVADRPAYGDGFTVDGQPYMFYRVPGRIDMNFYDVWRTDDGPTGFRHDEAVGFAPRSRGAGDSEGYTVPGRGEWPTVLAP